MNSVKDLRLKAGLSRAEAARRTGISEVTFWRFKNGKFQPRAETLKAMATLFGCSMEELLRSD